MNIKTKLQDIADAVSRFFVSVTLSADALAAEERLRRHGVTGDVARDVREGALMLAQLGIKSADIQAMAQNHYAVVARGITREDLYALGEIKRRAFRDGYRAAEEAGER